MKLACPKCGSRDARVASRRRLSEWIKGLFGIYPLRCRVCNSRWETSMWEERAWKYARCPRCYRQELTTWTTVYYHPPASLSLKISLGAKPYRCAACRCNFASFRPRRYKFEWRHQTHQEPNPAIGSNHPDMGLQGLAGTVGAKTDSGKPEETGHNP